MTTPLEPSLNPHGRTNVYEEHTLKCTLVFGAGALAKKKGKYLDAVRNSPGNFTITAPRSYRYLTGFRPGWTKCQAGAVFFPVVLTNNIAVDGTIIVETRTEAGVATDPASGDELTLEFDVSLDSSNDAEYA